MDTSEKYILMCKKAIEVQSLKIPIWGYCNFEIGDFFKTDKGSYVFDGGEYQPRTEGAVWLPRQDQLSEMIDTWNKKYSSAFFMNISSNSKYRNIPIEGYDSLEKHLLSFVMSEKYNKLWSEDKKDWEVYG